jgi:predicted AlkP superfamily phosphohydrolase/phosphomutase
MMSEETWDMTLTTLPATHRAGHRLWSTINVLDFTPQTDREEASDALRQVYVATDQAIGKIVEAAGSDATILIFSSHGMTHNHSREVILPEMLYRVLKTKKNRKKIILNQIRNLIPLSLRHRIKALMPLSIRKRMTLFWRLGQIDWTKTLAFVIPLEVRIGIRINLKGREAKGIVSSGKEFDELCQRIINGLSTFVDADNGKPLIKDLVLSRDVFEGEKVDWLPDIVGAWNEDSASEHRLIKSDLYGDIPWPTPGHNPEGRSGNHNNAGFLIAYGKNISKGNINDAHLIDLAPTILNLLGESIPHYMQGKVLSFITTKDPVVSKET